MKKVIKTVKQAHSEEWCIDNHPRHTGNKSTSIEFIIRNFEELDRTPIEGYILTDARFAGNGYGRIPFQKQNYTIKIKCNKKGKYIEMSNKPYYEKTRIYLNEFKEF